MAKVNWINGSIDPPETGMYYVIVELLQDIGPLKKGDVILDSDLYTSVGWGNFYKIYRVLSWASMLYPDIPADLQGRIKLYLGQEVRDDGTVSQ